MNKVNKVKKLIKTLEENNKKIKIILKENEKIMKELAKLVDK